MRASSGDRQRRSRARSGNVGGKNRAKRWSQVVTRESNALDLEPAVFTCDDVGDRPFPEALGGDERAPESLALPVPHVDADVLHQSRRQIA